MAVTVEHAGGSGVEYGKSTQVVVARTVEVTAVEVFAGKA